MKARRVTNRCVFCRIIDGTAPAQIIERRRLTTAFIPTDPHVPGHVLVVPNAHTRSAVASPMAAAVTTAAAARLLRTLGPQGNLMTSSGRDATQTVPHLHVHVLPRGPGDGLGVDWPWMRPDHEETP